MRIRECTSADSLTTTATSATVAATVAIAPATSAKTLPGGIAGHDQQEEQQDKTLYVHNIDTVK